MIYHLLLIHWSLLENPGDGTECFIVAVTFLQFLDRWIVLSGSKLVGRYGLNLNFKGFVMLIFIVDLIYEFF